MIEELLSSATEPWRAKYPEVDTLPVHADPDRIMQALTNLLGNALLATPAGGTVAINARRSGNRAEALVTDTGVGLVEDDPTIVRGVARGHGGVSPLRRLGEGRDPASSSACLCASPDHRDAQIHPCQAT